MNVLITAEVWLYTLMLVALPMVATAIYFVDTDPIQVIFWIYSNMDIGHPLVDRLNRFITGLTQGFHQEFQCDRDKRYYLQLE